MEVLLFFFRLGTPISYQPASLISAHALLGEGGGRMRMRCWARGGTYAHSQWIIRRTKKTSIRSPYAIGYFNEAQSGSVKNKRTRREGERGVSAAAPRLTCRFVLHTSAVAFSDVPHCLVLFYSLLLTDVYYICGDAKIRQPQVRLFQTEGQCHQFCCFGRNRKDYGI